MKIRIQGNSIRLRLNQTDLKSLNKNKAVESSIQFSENNLLIYKIETWDLDSITAEFKGNEIKINIPYNKVENWIKTDLIGLYEDQPLEANKVLKIIIEKDFKCLIDRPDENESDNFPNPNRK